MPLIILTAGICLITHFKMERRKNRNERRERRFPWYDTLESEMLCETEPQTSGWRAEEQTLKNGAGQMRVLFTRSCMCSPRCQYSRFPLFEDFYNWRETVSRINASTKGQSGELFNGIIITWSLDITFLSSFHRCRRVLASLFYATFFCLRFVTTHFYSWHFFRCSFIASFLLIRLAISMRANVETRNTTRPILYLFRERPDWVGS